MGCATIQDLTQLCSSRRVRVSTAVLALILGITLAWFGTEGNKNFAFVGAALGSLSAMLSLLRSFDREDDCHHSRTHGTRRQRDALLQTAHINGRPLLLCGFFDLPRIRSLALSLQAAQFQHDVEFQLPRQGRVAQDSDDEERSDGSSFVASEGEDDAAFSSMSTHQQPMTVRVSDALTGNQPTSQVRARRAPRTAQVQAVLASTTISTFASSEGSSWLSENLPGSLGRARSSTRSHNDALPTMPNSLRAMFHPPSPPPPTPHMKTIFLPPCRFRRCTPTDAPFHDTPYIAISRSDGSAHCNATPVDGGGAHGDDDARGRVPVRKSKALEPDTSYDASAHPHQYRRILSIVGPSVPSSQAMNMLFHFLHPHHPRQSYGESLVTSSPVPTPYAPDSNGAHG